MKHGKMRASETLFEVRGYGVVGSSVTSEGNGRFAADSTP
jgi:hypothetical protein